MKAPASLCGAVMLLAVLLQPAFAQPAGCTLKQPVVHLDFGRGEVSDFNTVSLQNYGRINGTCPTDGHYTFTPATYDCFAGDWFTLTQDHTPGDINGNMLLVNAAPEGGVFFSRVITGLSAGRTYEFALWMINVCRLYICCSSLSPNVSISISSLAGKKLASFRIGDLPQRTSPQWRKFASFFTMPPGESKAVLTMYNNTIGGCGNDFAMDDITFRECIPPRPAVAAAPKKVQPLPPSKIPLPAGKPANKPVVAKKAEPQKPAPRPAVTAAPKAEAPQKEALKVIPAPAPRLAEAVVIPPVLRTRANPLIKQIETTTGDLQVDLYDNGEIDGDTVSVYHNNKLIVSGVKLTQKPIRFRLRVDEANPLHELIMVAHNLGSIPPNTSLMIVTAGEKRYQVHISSSEQKNAKVVIKMEE